MEKWPKNNITEAISKIQIMETYKFNLTSSTGKEKIKTAKPIKINKKQAL